MKARLVKYQKDAAKSKRLMREAAELILAQEELTWGTFKIGRVELCSYFRQKDLCHQVPWGQGYRNSLIKWELTKTCLLLLSASRLTRHRERQNTTWKLLFSTEHQVICACEICLEAPFCSENKGPFCSSRLGLMHFPSYGAHVQCWSMHSLCHRQTQHTMALLSPCHTQSQSGFAVAADPHWHKWQVLPAQTASRSQRGVAATTQPPFWLPTSRISALQQHLHVVYISMQIFRLWFVTLRMTPRWSVGKAKQGPGKKSKTPPGPSRTMTELWDILSPNNGNLLGFCHRIVGFFFFSFWVEGNKKFM